MRTESFLLKRFHYYMRQTGIQHVVSVWSAGAENHVGPTKVLPETLIQGKSRVQRDSNAASDHPEHPNDESRTLGDKAALRRADLIP